MRYIRPPIGGIAATIACAVPIARLRRMISGRLNNMR
jgi:hypothetical protein